MYEMLCGSPPYQGDNVMEVLHKKANEPPRSLAELRPALSPKLVALVERAMARAPFNRPQTMSDLAYEIRSIETALVMTPPPVTVPGPGASSHNNAQGGTRAIFGEVSETRVVAPFATRRRYTILAGIAVVLIVAFGLFRLGRSIGTRAMKASEAVPVASQPGIPLPPPPLPSSLDGGGEVAPTALPEPTAPELTAEVTESPKAIPRGKPAVVVASKQQNEEALREARQLLHAQRYVEARTAFVKLLAAKPTRGVALAGLAQIAFQEKNYKEAVEHAKESARTGGGVEARVLLGDAYFKLDRFEEAKKAYNEALKLDPNNRVAGQGLRLIESQWR
jgi:hypothetical protein